MTTTTIAIPNKLSTDGHEYMVFRFGALVADESIDAPANRVHVENTAPGLGTMSSGYLSRSNARRWWRDAIAAGGKIV